MRDRSYIDIAGVILNVANERRGIGKSRMMYKGSLGYAQLKQYLPALIERGLLHYDRDAQRFETTQKGIRFLNTYKQLYKMMKSIPHQ